MIRSARAEAVEAVGRLRGQVGTSTARRDRFTITRREALAIIRYVLEEDS